MASGNAVDDFKKLLKEYYECKHQKINYDPEIIGNPGLLLELPKDESIMTQCISALDGKEIFTFNGLLDDVIDSIINKKSQEIAEAQTPAFTKKKTTRTAKKKTTRTEFPDIPPDIIGSPCPPSDSRKRRIAEFETLTMSIPEELEPAENIELVQRTSFGASTPQQNYLIQSTMQHQVELGPLTQNESLAREACTVNLENEGDDYFDDSLVKEFEQMFQDIRKRKEAMLVVDDVVDDDHVVVVPKPPVPYLHRHYERGILPAKLATNHENFKFFPELESYDINDEINFLIENTTTVPPFRRPLNTPQTESIRIRRPVETIQEIDSMPQISVEQLEGDSLIPQMTLPDLLPSSSSTTTRGVERIEVSAVVHRGNSEEDIPASSRRQLSQQEIERILFEDADEVMRETPVIHHSIVPPHAEANEQIDVQVGTEDRNWFTILRERESDDIQYHEPGHIRSRPRRKKRPRRIPPEMEAEIPEALEAEIPFNNIPMEDAPIEDDDFRIEFEEWKNMVLENVQSADKLVPIPAEEILDTIDYGNAMGDVLAIISSKKIAQKIDLIPNTLSKKEAILRLKVLFELQGQGIITIESSGTELEKVFFQE